MWGDTQIDSFIGKTFTSVIMNDDKDEIIFKVSDNESYKMYHSQDCCESVSVEDIEGDLNDLVGSPILQAEESTTCDGDVGAVSNNTEYESESYTWTFYKLATVKGYVTIRWYGTSNGYYSESVDIDKL